jgi:predicted dehydrogenase
MAGGLLFDLGSHLVDQAVVLFGPPVSVYAEVIARRVEVAVDDDMFVALTHAGGERSHLWASAVTPLLGPRFRVLGSTGGYVSWGLDPQEDALKAGGVPGTPGWGQLPEDRWGRLGTDASSERIETEPGAYQRYYEAIAASLLRGLPVPVPAAESVRVIEILEAARESSRTGTVVGFPRTPGPS